MKKIIVGLLSVCMLVCGAEVLPSGFLAALGVDMSANAAVSGDYEYDTLADGTVEIKGYKGSSTSVTIPETLAGKSVSALAKSAFYKSNIRAVTVPKSVKTIGEYCFYGCAGLNSVSLNSGLTTIERYVFYDCKTLTSIEIPDTVSTIGGYCFANCSALKSATLPNSLTELQDDTFSWCESLESIIIPGNVKSVGWQCFASCTSMTRVIMPNSLKTIAEDGFNRCKSLKSVSIPNSVTSIGNGAFENCTSLYSILIPGSVTEIGSFAFGYEHSTGAATHTKLKDIDFVVYGSTPTAEAYAQLHSFKYVDSRLTNGTVTLNKSVYEYNSKGINADLTVTNSLGEVLVNDTDYVVSFTGADKCGKATVTITGIGNYTESITNDISIIPAKAKLSAVKSKKTKSLKASWKKSKGAVTGYEVQVALNKKFTKSAKTYTIKKAKTTSKTIKKLKKKKKYYVRVRAFKTIDNQKKYGAWSAVKSVKCK